MKKPSEITLILILVIVYNILNISLDSLGVNLFGKLSISITELALLILGVIIIGYLGQKPAKATMFYTVIIILPRVLNYIKNIFDISMGRAIYTGSAFDYFSSPLIYTTIDVSVILLVAYIVFKIKSQKISLHSH